MIKTHRFGRLRELRSRDILSFWDGEDLGILARLKRIVEDPEKRAILF